MCSLQSAWNVGGKRGISKEDWRLNASLLRGSRDSNTHGWRCFMLRLYLHCIRLKGWCATWRAGCSPCFYSGTVWWFDSDFIACLKRKSQALKRTKLTWYGILDIAFEKLQPAQSEVLFLVCPQPIYLSLIKFLTCTGETICSLKGFLEKKQNTPIK